LTFDGETAEAEHFSRFKTSIEVRGHGIAPAVERSVYQEWQRRARCPVHKQSVECLAFCLTDYVYAQCTVAVHKMAKLGTPSQGGGGGRQHVPRQRACCKWQIEHLASQLLRNRHRKRLERMPLLQSIDLGHDVVVRWRRQD
jgi:hypothetical protein